MDIQLKKTKTKVNKKKLSAYTVFCFLAILNYISWFLPDVPKE